MRKIPFWVGAALILLSVVGCEENQTPSVESNDSIIMLPTPLYDSQTSIEQALQSRRSVRSFSPDPLTLAEVSQLLWAAQGITHPDGYRTAPSAGAMYPLEIYVVVGNVTDLPAGVYHYQLQDHELILTIEGDLRQSVYEAALQQNALIDGAIVLVITGIYERTTVKYGPRGIQYVHMEVGHAAQNIYLQVVPLGLGTVFIGAFHEEDVRAVLNLSDEVIPQGLMPDGRNLPAD
jgi:SagB-type dehydrogenase family enzyme